MPQFQQVGGVDLGAADLDFLALVFGVHCCTAPAPVTTMADWLGWCSGAVVRSALLDSCLAALLSSACIMEDSSAAVLCCMGSWLKNCTTCWNCGTTGHSFRQCAKPRVNPLPFKPADWKPKHNRALSQTKVVEA